MCVCMYVCMCVCMFVLICICCVALRYVVQLFQKIDFGTYYVYHNELLVVSVSLSHLRAGHYWAWSSLVITGPRLVTRLNSLISLPIVALCRC